MDRSIATIKRYAMSLLVRREYAQVELKQRLKRQFDTEDSEEIDQVLSELLDQGWQSDQRYVESMLRHYLSRGYGPDKIVYNFKQKGVEEGLIGEGLSELAADWTAHARDVHQKRFGQNPKSLSELQKHQRFMRSRGFRFEDLKFIQVNKAKCEGD